MHLFNQKILKRNFSNDVGGVEQGQGLPRSKQGLSASSLGRRGDVGAHLYTLLARRSRPLWSGLTTGFSIIELVVAVGILIALSTTLLFSYGSFDRRVTVDNLAHQIAVWANDARVSAMSVKRTRNDQGNFPGFGLHFDIATRAKFVYFADIDRDKTYDPLQGGEKCGDPLTEGEQEIGILRGNLIASICGDMPLGGQTATCPSVIPGNPLLYTTNTLDIVFMRPNPFDANIRGSSGTSYGRAEIAVTSPKGYRRTIVVSTTGQVSVR